MDASYAVVSEPLTSVETPRDVSTDISVDLKSQNAALQSRILELEANVQEILQKHEQDKTFLTESLAKKTEAMDRMRVKLKRYEFCVKEAILFLGRPIVSYHEWLNSAGNGPMNIQFPPVVSENVSKAQQEQQKPKQLAKVTENDPRRHSSLPQQMAEKQQNLQNALELSKTMTQAASNLEIQCLECIRLSLNYLTSAQSAIQGTARISVDPAKEATGQVIETRLTTDQDMAQANELVSNLSMATKRNQHDRHVSTSTLPDKEKVTPLQLQELAIPKSWEPPAKLNSILTKTTVIDEDDGDLAVKNFKKDDTSRSSSTKGCSQCRDRMIQMDKLHESIKDKDATLAGINQTLFTEREVMSRIQLSKDILEQELEELTEQLFEQANSMVSEETRTREELENKNHDLRTEMKTLQKRVEGRDEEVANLKKIVVALRAAKLRSTSVGSLSSSASIASFSLAGVPHGIFTFEPTTNSPLPHPPALFVDGVIYGELQDHIGASMLAMSQSPGQALITMLSTHFMKRCIAEDVEPCLFYSYNYSGAPKTFGAGGLSSSVKKRLLDNIQKGLCEIIVPSESEKGSLASSKVKCGICTVTKECQHKLRLGEKTKPEDLTVCRPCRDRVAACVDFFAYANYLRQNKQTFSILSIFRCFMWLRKRLASARVSSCSLFDGDFTSIASAYARDWEQQVHIQN